MSSSLQKWVGRNRPPRVQITYDVELGEAVEKRELPMVVGILSDLSGHPAASPPKLKARRLTEIDRDNFNDVMAKIQPRLQLSVADTITGNGDMPVELQFSNMADFHPDALVRQVPRLARLLEARQQLRDLLAKLDGNDELDAMLAQVLSEPDSLKALQHQARRAEGGTEVQDGSASDSAKDVPDAA